MRIPVQAKTLRGVAVQLDLRIELAHSRRLQGMLCSVKDEDLAIYTERGNDVRILWLVAGLVDLARMLNLVDNITLDGGNIARLSVTANLTTIVVIVIGVRGRGLGDLHIGNLQIVGAVV